MRRLFDPLFITYMAVWAGVHLGRRLHMPLPLNGYLTDLVAVPAIAHLTLTVTRRYIVRNRAYTYPLSYLLFIAGYVSVLFEWMAPRWSPAYTADAWDVAAYFAGGFFYYFFHGKRKPCPQPPHV